MFRNPSLHWNNLLLVTLTQSHTTPVVITATTYLTIRLHSTINQPLHFDNSQSDQYPFTRIRALISLMAKLKNSSKHHQSLSNAKRRKSRLFLLGWLPFCWSVCGILRDVACTCIGPLPCRWVSQLTVGWWLHVRGPKIKKEINHKCL